MLITRIAKGIVRQLEEKKRQTKEKYLAAKENVLKGLDSWADRLQGQPFHGGEAQMMQTSRYSFQIIALNYSTLPLDVRSAQHQAQLEII